MKKYFIHPPHTHTHKKYIDASGSSGGGWKHWYTATEK